MTMPITKIGGNALIVIPGPDAPRALRRGRFPILAEIVNQIAATGMLVTTATNVPDGLAALREQRFDFVIAEFDMPDQWDLCAELARQWRCRASEAVVVFLAPAMDFSFGPPEDLEAWKCPWTFMTPPFQRSELFATMQRIRDRARPYLTNFKPEMDDQGFALATGILAWDERNALLAAIAAVAESNDILRRGDAGGGVYGIRNLLDAVPAVRELAGSPIVRALVEPILGEGCFPVRGILFDKTPGANWKVPWHQDLTIAVRERRETPGYGPWSEKSGVTHVQPPVAVLERMLAVRLNLDPCGAENGPLRVLPRTHKGGRLNAAAIEQARREGSPQDCLAEAGNALLLRPLLLHASSAAASPGHRRVIHLEFANVALDGGLEWQAANRRSVDSAADARKMEA